MPLSHAPTRGRYSRIVGVTRAHGQGEHGGAGEGSAVDLGEGELAKEIGWTSSVKRGWTVEGVGGLGEKGENIPGRRARGKAYANGCL